MDTTRLFGILAAIFIISSVPVFAGDEGKCIPVKNLKEENLAFKGGEKLVFTVHFKWGLINADVAQATLKVDTTILNGRKVFHASLTGKTQKFYEKFFRVKEDLDSCFTRDGLKPMKFTRFAKEGKYNCTNLYMYDHTPGDEKISASLNNSRKGDFSATLPLDKCTYDIPLMYYVLRNIDTEKLEEGKDYPMTFAVDDDVYTLHFRYLGKENKYIDGIGSIRCLKLSFEVVSGEVFSGESDLYGWFSDDENRIPVWFTAPLKIGKVQGRLRSYSELRNPFSSIVE